MSEDIKNNSNPDEDIITKEQIKVKKPQMYQVVMHNDDYTSMEFVIHILQKFFQKNYDEAHGIMLKIHHDGLGICGIYTHEVAESKSIKVNRYSKSKGHPLKCSVQPC